MPPRPPRRPPPHRAAAAAAPAPAPAAGNEAAPRRGRQCRHARRAAAASRRPRASASRDGRWGLQEQVTPIGQEAAWFHDKILMPLIIVISVFVLLLLLWVIIRYRRSANPTPSRNTHNTTLEVVWTLRPGADPGGDRGAVDPAARASI